MPSSSASRPCWCSSMCPTTPPTSAAVDGGTVARTLLALWHWPQVPTIFAVACAAVGLVGHETDIFRKTLKYSLILLGIVIVVVLLQAFVIPWILPTAPVAS